LGYSTVDTNGYTFRRVLPEPHPDYQKFYATDVSDLTGFGKNDQTRIIRPGATGLKAPTWDYAGVTTNFRYLDYAVLSDATIRQGKQEDEWHLGEWNRFMSHSATVRSEYFSVNRPMWFFRTQLEVGKPQNKLVMSEEFTYTWHDVPSDPAFPWLPPNRFAVNRCIGCVNLDAFDVNNLNAPKGTVLFMGYSAQLRTPKVPTQQFSWEVEMKFAHRWFGDSSIPAPDDNIGWNWTWDQAQFRWDLITSIKGKKDPYIRGAAATAGEPPGTAVGQQVFPGRIYEFEELNMLTLIGAENIP